MSKIKLPTNLAFSRSITPSSAAFYSFESKQPELKSALNITEVTTVGTIFNYKDIHKDNGKSIKNSNPQTIDICYLPNEHDSFLMAFTVSFSSESLAPHSCNSPEFKKVITDLVMGYKEKGGYQYLADLYLKNIFSAKMLDAVIKQP